jgi:hypothetical protein
MVVAYYIFGAALAAGLTLGNRHLDWSLSVLVLPSMFFVHVCYKLFWAKRKGNVSHFRSHTPYCLACHNDIGRVRRFSRRRFCSNEHEQMYLAELEKIELARLQNARVHFQQASPIPEDVCVDLIASKVENEEQALSLLVHPSPA